MLDTARFCIRVFYSISLTQKYKLLIVPKITTSAPVSVFCLVQGVVLSGKPNLPSGAYCNNGSTRMLKVVVLKRSLHHLKPGVLKPINC